MARTRAGRWIGRRAPVDVGILNDRSTDLLQARGEMGEERREMQAGRREDGRQGDGLSSAGPLGAIASFLVSPDTGASVATAIRPAATDFPSGAGGPVPVEGRGEAAATAAALKSGVGGRPGLVSLASFSCEEKGECESLFADNGHGGTRTDAGGHGPARMDGNVHGRLLLTYA